MAHDHQWRQISAAFKWSQLRCFESWNQTDIIVHSTSPHRTVYRMIRPGIRLLLSCIPPVHTVPTTGWSDLESDWYYRTFHQSTQYRLHDGQIENLRKEEELRARHGTLYKINLCGVEKKVTVQLARLSRTSHIHVFMSVMYQMHTLTLNQLAVLQLGVNVRSPRSIENNI